MGANQRLLTNCSLFKRCFNTLLNETATQITMDDLQRIPRTDPLRINQSALETFMDQNKNKSCIFIGIEKERKHPFIAFNFRPAHSDGIHTCSAHADSDETTKLKFVFDESRGIVDIVVSNWREYRRDGGQRHYRRYHLMDLIPTEVERLLACAQLIKVGSFATNKDWKLFHHGVSRIPMIRLDNPRTCTYCILRYPKTAVVGVGVCFQILLILVFFFTKWIISHSP
eukprot:771433_1